MYPVLKPRHIAKLVSMGIADGWRPFDDGAPHCLKVHYEELFTREI
jgi:hypothetical protein